MDKAALRSSVRAQRRLRSPEDQDEIARQIATRAVAFLPAEPRDVTCYASMPGEPGTGPLIADLLRRGHRVWLPRTVDQRLVWVQVALDSEYAPGLLGIREPRGAGNESLDFAAVVLMPALAVDPSGRRLGQGGGYFDRALSTVASLADGGPILVALVHDDEVIDAVPTERHDRLVDAIVTSARTLRTGRVGDVD